VKNRTNQGLENKAAIRNGVIMKSLLNIMYRPWVVRTHANVHRTATYGRIDVWVSWF